MTTEKRTHRNLLLDNSGFTLLEIIAVLVILSILAVVAVPRYFDLQTSAREKAIQAAMSEAIGRVNGYFAKSLLGGQAWDTIEYSTNTLGTNLGDDFGLEIATDGTNTITITLRPDSTAMSGFTNTAFLTKTIERPGKP